MPHCVHTTPWSSKAASFDQYWNVNVPETEWTSTCPDYLLGQPEKNVQILSTPDCHYRKYSWSEVQKIAQANRPDLFQRVPSELRRYLYYIYNLQKEPGSVLGFVQQHRLHWESITPSSAAPFTNPDDYKILFNDWPYGIDDDISHLVVWTKFLIEDDPKTDDLTDKARAEIEDFVTKTFCDETRGGVPRERLIWFKNWNSLKSVHALEHFHVMIFKASREFLVEVTGGDQAMAEKTRVQEEEK